MRLGDAIRRAQISDLQKRIESVEAEYRELRREIARGCMREGYPSHGSNYDLRVEYHGAPYEAELDELYEQLYELTH